MKHIRFTLAPLALAITPYAFAADDTKRQPAEIVITASRSARQPSAQLSYVINRDRIEQSTATTLPDLLRQIPGIQIRSLFGTASAEATVDLGAMGPAASQNTLILIDGRRQNDIDSSAADIGGLSLDQVERIEVLPGSGGVLYGEGAVGGVVNIITRNRELNRTEAKIGLGSYQTREAQILNHFAKDSTRGQAFLKDTQTDGYRQNSYVRRLEAGTKIEHDLSQDTQAYSSMQFSRQDQGFPGFRSVTASSDELHSSPRGASSLTDFGDTTRIQGTFGLVKSLGDNARWVTEASHRHKSQQAYLGFSYLDTDLNTSGINSRLERRNRLGDWQGNLVTGMDLSYSQYRSDRANSESEPAIHKLDIMNRNIAGFGHQTFKKATHTLTIGARYADNVTHARDRYFIANDPFPFDAEAAPLRLHQSAKQVEIAFSEALSARTNVGIGFARNTRLGTVDDLYEGYGPTRSFSVLRPQVGRHFTTFIQHRIGDAEFGLTAFYHLINNEIHFSNESFTNDNLDPTRRQGVTLTLNTPIADKTRLYANASRQSAVFREGQNAGNAVPLVARYLGNLGITHDFTERLQGSLSGTYTGSRHFENDDEGTFGRKMPVMMRVDASLRYRINQWTLSATVLNLTNERAQYDYAASSSSSFATTGRFNAYPLPTRNVMFTATYRF